MANPKCKYCREEVSRKDAHKQTEISINNNAKIVYLHKECINDYNELMDYKAKEIEWFNEIIEYLKELLNYSEKQSLPTNVITRIQDIRNGTIIQKGVGRVVKSKEGYPYDVILDTLLTNADSIRWFLANKNFESEKKKINYLMVILESNINDTYMKFKNKVDFSNIKKRDNMIEEEKESINLVNTINTVKKVKNEGISKFLNDDEF